MEAEAVTDRPESPKKKMKSNSSALSEAQSSDYSECDRSGENTGHNSEMNGVVPTRSRPSPFIPDSSSERVISQVPINPRYSSPPRIQEEEVSSSENSITKTKKEGSDIPAEGDADSILTEPEDLTSVCDSASSDAFDKL